MNMRNKLLAAGLLSITALSRSGSTLFWRTEGEPTGEGRAGGGAMLAIAGLLGFSISLSFAGHWVLPYVAAPAEQVSDVSAYRHALHGFQPVEVPSP